MNYTNDSETFTAFTLAALNSAWPMPAPTSFLKRIDPLVFCALVTRAGGEIHSSQRVLTRCFLATGAATLPHSAAKP